MKTLFLVRHSKATARKANLPDFRRTLVKAGEKKSMDMAKKLKKEGVIPDLMISSTASRALETAHLFARHLNYPAQEIMVKDALYNEMSPEALLYLVHQIDNKFKSVMLFGHNPAFSDFASYLVRGFNQDIPKTGIVGIKLEQASWKQVEKGSGKLEFFEYPKRLKKTMKRLEEEIGSKLIKTTHAMLEKVDARSAKKIRMRVEKEINKIARDFVKIMKAAASETGKKSSQEEEDKKKKQKSTIKSKVEKSGKKPALKVVTKTLGKAAPKTPKAAVPKKTLKTQPSKKKRAGTPKISAPKKPPSA